MSFSYQYNTKYAWNGRRYRQGLKVAGNKGNNNIERDNGQQKEPLVRSEEEEQSFHSTTNVENLSQIGLKYENNKYFCGHKPKLLLWDVFFLFL